MNMDRNLLLFNLKIQGNVVFITKFKFFFTINFNLFLNESFLCLYINLNIHLLLSLFSSICRADIIDFSCSVSYILGVESTGQVAVWADENEQVGQTIFFYIVHSNRLWSCL